MEEKILQQLKDSISKTGKTSLSDKTLMSFVGLIKEKITDESQISDLVKAYLPFLGEVQANINSIAADSVTSKEATLKAEHNRTIEELKKSVTPSPPLDDKPSELGTLFTEFASKHINPLAQAIAAMQGNEQQKGYQQKLQKNLADKGIASWYYTPAIEDRAFQSEEELIAFTDKLNLGWENSKQELANQGFKLAVAPVSGEERQKTETEAFVACIEKGTKAIIDKTKAL